MSLSKVVASHELHHLSHIHEIFIFLLLRGCCELERAGDFLQDALQMKDLRCIHLIFYKCESFFLLNSLRELACCEWLESASLLRIA